MPSQRQVPFFLSSVTNHGANSSNTKFDVHMNPPFEIPGEATSARAFVQTATIPYVTPNVVTGKNSLYVRIPIKDTDGDNVPDGGRDVQISIPEGLYSLSGSDTASLEDAINEAVNKQILDDVDTAVGVGEFMLQDAATKKPNFCTLTPNYALNRVQLTLNHPFTGINFTDARTTLDILGFTQNCLNEVPKFTANSLSFTVTMSDSNTQVFAIADGTYTAKQLENEVNTKCIASNVLITQNIIKVDTLEVFIEAVIDHSTGQFVDYKTGRFQYHDEADVRFTKYLSNGWGTAGAGDPAGTNGTQAGNAAGYNGFNIHSIFGHERSDGITGTNLVPTLLVSSANSFSASFVDRAHNVWSTGVATGKTFLATNRAVLDKLTEVGIACNPLITGGVTSSGQPSAGVLARFQIEGTPGSLMTFKPPTPIRSDISDFIGSSVDKLTFSLVDQNGDAVTDLQEEHWSVTMVVEYDLP